MALIKTSTSHQYITILGVKIHNKIPGNSRKGFRGRVVAPPLTDSGGGACPPPQDFEDELRGAG